MKAERALQGALWVCCAGAMVAAWRVAQPPAFITPRAPQQATVGADELAPLPAESLARLVRHDPFRVERAPAPIPYDPARGQGVSQPAPGPLRPTLALAGLVRGGSLEPSALIEGLPNSDGARLLKVGDTSGGIRVREIGMNNVVLVGWDTVWTLRVRHPWD